MMEERIVFWLITSSVVAVGTLAVIFIKQWIKDLKDDISLLFQKIDYLLEKISEMANHEELKELEKRVRRVEDRINKCKNCNE